MGRGNWFPGHSDTPRSLVYVDLSADTGGRDPAKMDPDELFDLGQQESEAWRQFKADLHAALGEYFGSVTGRDWQAKQWAASYGHRSDLMLFASDHLAVVCDAGGEYHHQGVAICPLPREDDEDNTAAQEAFDNFNCDAIWSALAAMGYKLSCRTGPWTSAPYAAKRQEV